jgi:hypothetical protein
VFLLGIALEEEEGIVEEDNLIVDVLDHDDDEVFSAAVNFFVPLEVWDDGEIDAEEGVGDGLDLGLEPARLVRTWEGARQDGKPLAEAWGSCAQDSALASQR